MAGPLPRNLLLAAALLLAGFNLASTGAADTTGAGCTIRDVPGMGPACLLDNGLYEVFDPHGESLGTTHGLDPVPDPLFDAQMEAAAASAGMDASSQIECHDDDGSYHTIVFYARAHDDHNNGPGADRVRELIHVAAALVDDAAKATGARAALDLRCKDGDVEVIDLVLTTDKDDASFSTVVSELRAMGYDSGRNKHLVLYDDPGACGCGGLGHFIGDSSPGQGNANNGNAGPLYAMSFYYSASILLHELGHNMGAVQTNSPYTSGAAHCIDGRDIMCYNDGGPTANQYSNRDCPHGAVWDCSKDDYFNANPAPGSYLAEHWNIADPANRFVHIWDDDPIPSAQQLGCAVSSLLHESRVCEYHPLA
ncbi:MAG: hypothetical protein ACPGQL_10915 [Thermoplasmatota archaeon]